jgi:hypothetical protein
VTRKIPLRIGSSQRSDLPDDGWSQFSRFTAPSIDRCDNEFQMLWIYTRMDAAQMVKLRIERRLKGRQRAVNTLVIYCVSPTQFPIPIETIPVFVESALPNPARGFVAAIFDEIVNSRKALVVILYESLRLAFATAILQGRLTANRSSISAAAMAKSKGYFHDPLSVGRQRSPRENRRLTPGSMSSALADLGQQLEYSR